MFLIPSHQSRPSDDPIFALNKEANEKKAAGQSVVNATLGALLDDNGGLVILPSTTEALRSVSPADWATYAPIAGNPEFVAAVRSDLLQTVPELFQASVAVATPGGSGALRHAIANFLEPGQSLLTTSYFWGPYQTLVDEADRKLESFPMFNEKGGLDVEALAKAASLQLASQGRVLLFINDPCQNPTGDSMTRAEWDAVVETLLSLSSKGPITLLVDIAYAAYGSGTGREFLPALLPLLGKVGLLFAWSASKTFTHYGLRVGALVACVADAKERVATEAALSYSSRGTWSNCNRGGLVAITKLLTVPALREACDKERAGVRELLLDRVKEFNLHATKAGLRYPRYEGGFFVTTFPTESATEKAKRMRDKGVYVVPTQGALRVGICAAKKADIARLVDALATA